MGFTLKYSRFAYVICDKKCGKITIHNMRQKGVFILLSNEIRCVLEGSNLPQGCIFSNEILFPPPLFRKILFLPPYIKMRFKRVVVYVG